MKRIKSLTDKYVSKVEGILEDQQSSMFRDFKQNIADEIAKLQTLVIMTSKDLDHSASLETIMRAKSKKRKKRR